MNESSGTDEANAVERRRAATYRLLAELYHEPDSSRLQQLTETSPRAVRIDVERLTEAADDPRDLSLDHAQLFVGPFELAAPPYESVYVDSGDRVMTESTEAVRTAYRQAGVDISLDEPPDHVAAELEFVSLLVVTEAEALVAGDLEAVEHYLRRQYEFLSEHLGRWISGMTGRMRDNANTEFYRALADETRRFVEADGRLLAERLDHLETTEDGVASVLNALDAPEAADTYKKGRTEEGGTR